MTDSQDSPDSRPISVAELLARNGTIGAPPVSKRRRRRRGNADAVTVAELTGEIPIIRDVAPEIAAEPEPEAEAEAEPEAEAVAEPEPDLSEPEAGEAEADGAVDTDETADTD